MNRVGENSLLSTRAMARVSMLSVIAAVLMYFQMPLGFIAPSFIKLDVSDLPTLIGAFAMGPQYAILIAGLKNILHIFLEGTQTGGIGEISNFLIGSTFAFIASIIYRRDKSYKNAIIGLFLGVITMTALAMFSNYFVIFPLYAKVMPMEAIIGAGSAITPKIHDLWSMMVYSILPFNLIKGFTNAAIALVIYKKVSPMFKGF